MARHYIIYVPGLADKTNYHIGQRVALMLLWRTSHLHVFYFRPRWADTDEPFTAKRARLLETIDNAAERGFTVSIVTSSAGASLALCAFHERPQRVHKVVSICAKLHHPETVPKILFDANPAFRHSMAAYQRIEPSLTAAQRARILVVRAKRDSYVPSADGAVKGAHTYIMRSAGHVFSIFMALTVYRHKLIQFIKGEQK
jgi:pimeloyl-ACP methyl ester carboxylesterase